MGMWTPGGNDREMDGARRKGIRQALDSKPGGLGASTDMENKSIAPWHGKRSPKAATIYVNSGCPSSLAKCVSNNSLLPWQILFIFLFFSQLFY